MHYLTVGSNEYVAVLNGEAIVSGQVFNEYIDTQSSSLEFIKTNNKEIINSCFLTAIPGSSLSLNVAILESDNIPSQIATIVNDPSANSRAIIHHERSASVISLETAYMWTYFIGIRTIEPMRKKLNKNFPIGNDWLTESEWMMWWSKECRKFCESYGAMPVKWGRFVLP